MGSSLEGGAVDSKELADFYSRVDTKRMLESLH